MAKEVDSASIELPADLVDKARTELGETPSVRSSAISDLRHKLQALKPEERPHREDDVYLTAFLRPQKWRVDVALKKLRAYTAWKNEHAGLLRDMRVGQFREVYSLGFFQAVLKRDQEGRSLICIFPAKLPVLPNPDVLIQWTIFSLEQTGLMFDPYLQVNGVVMVEDLAGFTISQAIRTSFSGPMRRAQNANFKFMREACPYRMRGLLIINEPSYMDMLMALVRPFMSKKLLDRMALLGRGQAGMDALHQRVAPTCLPMDLGGTLEEGPMAFLEHAEKMEREGRMLPVL